jgi:hypothetical protein
MNSHEEIYNMFGTTFGAPKPCLSIVLGLKHDLRGRNFI